MTERALLQTLTLYPIGSGFSVCPAVAVNPFGGQSLCKIKSQELGTRTMVVGVLPSTPFTLFF